MQVLQLLNCGSTVRTGPEAVQYQLYIVQIYVTFTFSYPLLLFLLHTLCVTISVPTVAFLFFFSYSLFFSSLALKCIHNCFLHANNLKVLSFCAETDYFSPNCSLDVIVLLFRYFISVKSKKRLLIILPRFLNTPFLPVTLASKVDSCIHTGSECADALCRCSPIHRHHSVVVSDPLCNWHFCLSFHSFC